MATFTAPVNPDLVRTGPGVIYIGRVADVTLPTEIPSNTSPLDTSLVPIGPTTDGSSVAISTDRIEINVAERLRPVKYKAGNTSTVMSFSMAEVGPKNLALAIPGATLTETAGGAIRIAMPKVAGTDRYTVVWVAEDGLVALVLSRVFISTSGDLTNGAANSGDPQAIPVECAVEDAGEGVDDVYWLFDPSIADVTI